MTPCAANTPMQDDLVLTSVGQYGAPDAAATDPTCLSCGYSLIGLDLPRPCPECGVTADPPRQLEEAREWFGTGVRWNWWLRANGLAAGLLYALSDSESCRIARRMRRRWLWLPALLCSITVLGGASIEIESDVKISYYRFGKKPVRVNDVTDHERPYNFNLNLFREGFFSPGPPSYFSRRVEELVERRFCFVVPRLMDPILATFILPPWLIVLCARLGREVICRAAAMRQPIGAVRERRRSLGAAAALISQPYGIVLWIWYTLIVVVGISYLMSWFGNPRMPEWMLWTLLISGAGCWLAGNVLAWGRLLRADHRQLITGLQKLFGLVLAMGMTVIPFVAIGALYVMMGLL